LALGHRSFGLHPGPYSPPADVEAPLVVARNMEELAEVSAEGAVLLLIQDLAREQLFPREFPFFTAEEHEQFYVLLERKGPAAILAATGRNPETAGGAYPFPLIEDGGFPIPTAYTTDEMGEEILREHAEHSSRSSHAAVHLRIVSARSPARARQIEAIVDPPEAAEGPEARRILLSAHIDSKEGSPGAIDNAGGVVVLMLVAELLRDYHGPYRVELIPFNGEDYYSAPGQVDWLRRNENLDDVAVVINIDGAGYYHGPSEYSFYNLDDGSAARVDQVFQGAAQAGLGAFEAGEAWYQGDHAIFVQRGVPAVALTSASIWELSASVTHTVHDVPEIVDPGRLAAIARVLRRVIGALSG
jgi:aminopeptidase YwaD